MARRAIVVVCAFLGACASTAPGGRAQVVAPSALSSVYSSIDLNLRLATTPAIVCDEPQPQCQVNRGFDRQVARLGERLAVAAYEIHPHLKERIPAFSFVVADKSEIGTTSDAGGTVVVYRAIHSPGADEDVIAFLVAREMGHVIARHHDEASAASIVASVVVRLLLPITNLTGTAAFVAGSAASAVGAKAMTADNDPRKIREATTIAMELLARQGWNPVEVGNAVSAYAGRLGDNAWGQSVRASLMVLLETPVDEPAPLLALNP